MSSPEFSSNGYEIVHDADLEVLLETYDMLKQRKRQFEQAAKRVKEMRPRDRGAGKKPHMGRFTGEGRVTPGKKVAYDMRECFRLSIKATAPAE